MSFSLQVMMVLSGDYRWLYFSTSGCWRVNIERKYFRRVSL